MKHKCGRKALPASLKTDKPQSVRLTPEAQCALKYLRTHALTRFNLSATVSELIIQLACGQGFRGSSTYAEFEAEQQRALAQEDRVEPVGQEEGEGGGAG
ncbi:hypothetical protein [Megalodesulfovibrio paquesii]